MKLSIAWTIRRVLVAAIAVTGVFFTAEPAFAGAAPTSTSGSITIPPICSFSYNPAIVTVSVGQLDNAADTKVVTITPQKGVVLTRFNVSYNGYTDASGAISNGTAVFTHRVVADDQWPSLTVDYTVRPAVQQGVLPADDSDVIQSQPMSSPDDLCYPGPTSANGAKGTNVAANTQGTPDQGILPPSNSGDRLLLLGFLVVFIPVVFSLLRRRRRRL